MKKIALTKLEKRVMEILWDSDEPLSASQIHSHAEELSVYSIRQVIKKLLTMQYIAIAGYGENKKAIMRLYTPVITQTQYVQSFLSKRNSFELAANIVDDSENIEDLLKLQKVLEDKINSLKKG